MCGEEDSAQISFPSFKEAMQERSREMGDSYSPLIRQAFDILNSKDSPFDIHWKRQNSPTENDYKPYITFSSSSIDTADIVFYAENESLTLKCRAKLFIRENLVVMTVGLVAVIFAVKKIRECLYNRRAKKLSGNLYNNLKSDLEGMGRQVTGLN